MSILRSRHNNSQEDRVKTLLKRSMLVAALFALSPAFAGIAQLNGTPQTGDGTVGNPYDFGTLTPAPSLLTVTVFGAPGSAFEEYANFMTSSGGSGSSVANTYTLTFGGISIFEIDNLTIEVWDNTHPNGLNLYSTFSGDNTTAAFTLPTAGQYHLDISGTFGPNASAGQYSVAIAAVPEPETYAMLLAGLGAMGFVARRRRAG
jgi:hypothetical protein